MYMADLHSRAEEVLCSPKSDWPSKTKQIGLQRAHLSLYIINSPAGRVGAGPTVGLVHFLNAAVHLIFHLHRKKEFGSSKGILVGAVSVSALQVKSQVFYSTWSKH